MAKWKPVPGPLSWASEEDMRRFCEDVCLRPDALGTLSGKIWQPPTDIHETPTAIVIKMDIAGIDPREAEVTLHGDEIIVRGRRCDRTAPDRTAIHHMEITYGCFERRFVMNVPFDADGVSAAYEKGFLLVSLPKAERPTHKRVKLTIHL